VEARPITARDGYDRWAPFYDEPGNQLLDIEQPIVREIFDSLPCRGHSRRRLRYRPPVDLVVCAIALSHVPDLAQALTELVRVLRPDGHLVISDSRGLIGDIGLPLVRIAPDGTFGYMPVYARLASDYLAAALPLGLQVRRCEEPRRPSPLVDDDGTPLYDNAPPPEHVSGSPPNNWSLHRWCTDATNAAYRENPAAIIWHFQLSAD
jgi:SAM-dependent methyltransferase